jgi:hypothetical protein
MSHKQILDELRHKATAAWHPTPAAQPDVAQTPKGSPKPSASFS